jgi:hypothetical protein
MDHARELPRGPRPIRFVGPIFLLVGIVVLSGVATLSIAPVHPSDRSGPVPVLSAVPAPHPGPAKGPTIVPDVSGENKLIVNSRDPSLIGSEGLRLNVTAWTPVSLPANSSFQIADEEVIGRSEAVFGLFQTSGANPVPFYVIFNNSTDQQIREVIWSTLPILAGTSYNFTLSLETGTTWELTVDGVPFGNNAANATFDFGAPSVTWAGGIGFSEIAFYLAQTSVPDEVDVPLAMAVEENGSWVLPASAYLSAPGDTVVSWGIIGRAQLSSLAPGEIETGTQIARTQNNTTLWSGGIVPVLVSLTPPAPSIVGTETADIQIAVTTSTNPITPLSGVYVLVRDGLNGIVLPNTVETGANGTAQTVIEMANVSVASTDQISARITLFGYAGTAASSMQVTPAVQVLFSLDPSPGPLRPGSNLSLSIRAANVSGQPAPFVPLFISVTGPATITPDVGLTNVTGVLLARLSILTAGRPVTLIVLVTGGGAWGHLNLSLGSAQNPPDPWVLYGTSAAVGAIVVIAAVLLLLLVRRRKRPQRLPKLFRPDLPGDTTPSGTTDGPDPSRTLP